MINSLFIAWPLWLTTCFSKMPNYSWCCAFDIRVFQIHYLFWWRADTLWVPLLYKSGCDVRCSQWRCGRWHNDGIIVHNIKKKLYWLHTSPEKACPFSKCSEPWPSSLPKCSRISSRRWLYVIGPPEMLTRCSLSNRRETWRPVLYIVPPTWRTTKNKEEQLITEWHKDSPTCERCCFHCSSFQHTWQLLVCNIHGKHTFG